MKIFITTTLSLLMNLNALFASCSEASFKEHLKDFFLDNSGDYLEKNSSFYITRYTSFDNEDNKFSFGMREFFSQPVASIQKIIIAYLLMKYKVDMKKTIVYDAEARRFDTDFGGGSLPLNDAGKVASLNEKISVSKHLYNTLYRSTNSSAYMLSRYLLKEKFNFTGNYKAVEKKFSEIANAEIRSLLGNKYEGARFTNAHGLNNYGGSIHDTEASAREMARIYGHTLYGQGLSKFLQKYGADIPYKTGYTKLSGKTLASALKVSRGDCAGKKFSYAVFRLNSSTTYYDFYAALLKHIENI